ncbi:MAG: condensation domain-containing protein [Bacteroidota bacterium]
MEIFIGNRIEIFKMFSNGLYNVGGMQPSSSKRADEEQNESNASAMFRLDVEEESMLLHCLLEAEQDHQNEQTFLDFKHDFSKPALEEALDFIVRKCDKLRSIYLFDEYSVPVKKVEANVFPTIQEANCTGADLDERMGQAEQMMKAQNTQVFDFKTGPLFNLTLLKIDEQHFRLVWTCHAILLMQTGLTDLTTELWNLYQSFSNEY